MKTYSVKEKDIKRSWHVIDATDKPLGRLSSHAASLLMGKNKATYAPNLDTGDFVIIINAAKVRITGTTGKKAAQKTYYRHSTYPGGFKTNSLKDVLENRPARVIEMAVKGMLPHNNLGRAMYRKLKVYAGESHPHQAQVTDKAGPAAKTTEA